MTADVAATLATANNAVQHAMQAAARAARATVPGLAVVPAERLDDALRAMADLLRLRAAQVLEANAEDMDAARADGIRDALLDRLRLDDARLEAIAGQLRALAEIPAEPSRRTIRELPGGLLPGGVPPAGRRDRGQLRGPARTSWSTSPPSSSSRATRACCAPGRPRSVRPSRWPTTSSRPRWTGPGSTRR